MDIDPNTKVSIPYKDYETIHAIHKKWKEFHNRYFRCGKDIAEISDLFNKLGVEDAKNSPK